MKKIVVGSLLGLCLVTVLPANNTQGYEVAALKELQQKSSLSGHKIVGKYPFAESKKVLVISTNTLSDEEACMACPATLSFFIFMDGKLIKSYIDMVEAGVMGKAPDGKDFKMIKIGKNKDALLLTTYSPARGYDIYQKSIYSIEEDKVKEVFSQVVGTNDEAATDRSQEAWQASLKFEQTKSPYYDIILHKKGIKNAKPYDETIVFKFDGTRYMKVK
jgi:hypothetical protein